MFKINRPLILIFFLISCAVSWSQTNVPPNIEAIGDAFYCPLSETNIVTSFNIIDPDDTQIDALHIQISLGYVLGQDRLILAGNHPNVVATWSSIEGKLSLKGPGGTLVNYTDIIAAVNAVVFESTALNVSGEKHFSFTIGDANYLPSTGHYYEYIQNIGITWTTAKTAAEGRTYFGLQGYLATITSAEEAQLSGEQAAGAGWIGGSDVQTEGVWKWMSGPESGVTFWNGGINGSTPNYANWNTGEPNSAGNEDYAHITAPGIGINGSWNDLSNTGATSGSYQPKGYIVEYGGMPGDPIVDISASTKLSIPSIIGKIGAERCGSGVLVIEATPSVGEVLWFDDPIAGVQIGTGLTHTTPVINVTTTYYALASVDGCTEGIRTPVLATIKTIPSITSVNGALICNEGNATLEAIPSSGIINWYDSITGGSLLGIGNTFTTPVINTTTTYFAEVELNGCFSITREPVVLTVQHTPLPVANPIQSFCDIDIPTVTDLIITGSNILWYTSDSGGTALITAESLNTGTYYATQTLNGCETPSRLAVDVIVHATVNTPDPSMLPVMQECDMDLDGNDANGYTSFNLRNYEPLFLNGALAADYTIRYFTDALYVNLIATPEVFINTIQNGQTIYVQILNNAENTCLTSTFFNVQVDALPNIQTNIVFKNCDEDGVVDGFTDYNLNEANDVITNGNSAIVSITYHLNLTDAELKINAINPLQFNNIVASIVYARVENINGCYRVSTVTLQVSTTSFAAGYLEEIVHCDDDSVIDGLHEFDLTQISQSFIDQFPAGQNLSVHYYRNLTDAQLEQNEIDTATNFINTIPFLQDLYVRVESNDNGDCFGIGPHLRLIVNSRPEFEVDQSNIFCLNGDPIVLEIYNPNGNYTYEWSNENADIISTLQNATITSGGIYTVIAMSDQGCESFPYSFNVVESGIASITIDDVAVVDFSNNNTISINTSNLGLGDYEFALDDEFGFYQDAPFFDHVGAGSHWLYVRDKNGCGVARLEVFVLGFPKFFTPNNDGYHDTWNINGWSNAFAESSIVYIYDRYGKLLKQLTPFSNGWTGTFNGNKLRSTDYWFTAKLVSHDGTFRVMHGHFSLVR